MKYTHYSDVHVFECSKAEWKKRWPNFSPKELSCKCCGEYWHDEITLDMIQNARNEYGSMIINSAHRCEKHNHLIGGAKASEHLKIALDIKCERKKRRKLLTALFNAGFTTFGLYNTFIHTDKRPWRLWIMSDKRIWESIYDEVVKRAE